MTSAAAATSSSTGSAARASRTCGHAHFADYRIGSAQLHRQAKHKLKTAQLHTLRTLIQQNVWNNGAGGDSPDFEWLDVLTDEDPTTPPPRPPWRAPTWALPVEGADPRIYVSYSEHYDDTPRGSLPPIGNLVDSWGPVTPINFNNYCTTVITLCTRLPFAFGWPVGDAEWAMGIVRGAHGGKWGDYFHCSGTMTPGATHRPMAAHLTWRGIPLPRSPQPLARRAQQPHVPPPRPGTYGNAAVARMMAPQLLLLLPENRDHHHPSAPVPRHNSDQGDECTRPGTARPNGLHVLRPIHLRPPPHPSPHNTNRTPPTPHGLRTLQHHQGPARHRAPDKSVRPNGQHNDTHHNTTWPEGSRDTGRHLSGAERCPAPRIQGQWAPDRSNPLAQHSRTWTRPRNPKQHPARPHTVTSRQTAGQRRHRPARSPTYAMEQPDRPTAGQANAPPEDPPTQTRAATPTNTRPSDTVHPKAHNPTESPNPQAPATSGTTAPGDLPTTAQAELAS